MPLTWSPALVVPGKPFKVVVTSTSSLMAVVLVLQSLAWTHTGLSGPLGSTVFCSTPAAATVARSTTCAWPPGARPAVTLQVAILPATGAQVASCVDSTCTPLTPAGRLSVSTMADLVAPVPVLLAVMVQVSKSPTLAVALSTLLCTVTCGATRVVVAWQAPAVSQAGLSPPLASTRLARLPPTLPRPVTTILRLPLPAVN